MKTKKVFYLKMGWSGLSEFKKKTKQNKTKTLFSYVQGRAISYCITLLTETRTHIKFVVQFLMIIQLQY